MSEEPDERKKLYNRIIFLFKWRGHTVNGKADNMLQIVDNYANQQVLKALEEAKSKSIVAQDSRKPHTGEFNEWFISLSVIEEIERKYK